MSFAGDALGGLRGAGRMVFGIAAPGTAEPPAASVRNSFAAPLLCLPIAAFAHWADWHGQRLRAPLWHAAAVDLLLYAIGWAGFLLLCRPLLAALGETRAWPRLVLAWNWCGVAQYAVVLLAALLVAARVDGIVLRVALLVSLFWQTWIEWRALRPVSPSAWHVGALVALDVVLALTAQSATVSLGG